MKRRTHNAGMIKKRDTDIEQARIVQKWFLNSVTYEGEPYVMDLEQAAAVADESCNTIVIARAGSGKTRTLVAKIVYLIARKGLRPDEILVFVFNANAAAEVNARLAKMMVDGKAIIVEGTKVAYTFHAFSRMIVYEVCGGKDKVGKILAEEKEAHIRRIVQELAREQTWTPEEVEAAAKQMTIFVNRAEQQFLCGEHSLSRAAYVRLTSEDLSENEREFIELGLKVYARYHWYLLKKRAFGEYGTDFNLIVSWASKLIEKRKGGVEMILAHKKYLLIDEYQDFSQLFLAAVRAIRQVATEAKLFVVGDDWQAINRFAGSEVEYFKNFEAYFPMELKKLEISTNYRCDYEIVDTARKFMRRAMGERGNFRAKSKRAGKVVLVNPKETELTFAMVEYDLRASREDLVFQQTVSAVLGRTPKMNTVRYIKTIAKIIWRNRKARDILILHRNNETNLESLDLVKIKEILKVAFMKLNRMNDKEFDDKVQLMTIHKSKGLEAEIVIIMEADEGVIPKQHPDTELYRIFGETAKVALDDQKRLFYVAMTRAKKRLYIIHDDKNGEGFIKFLGRGLEKWGE